MATLQKIRTRAGLLVAIVIGISLAAFILGDMLKIGKFPFSKRPDGSGRSRWRIHSISAISKKN